MLRSALPRCLGAGFALVLLIAKPGAASAQLAATLCAQADLISGECRSVERLSAGAPGFAVSIRSGFADRVLVSVAWERAPLPGTEAARLAEDMVVLSAGQTKLVPFQSPPSGLAPGSYRLVVSVAGQQAQTLSFDAVEGSAAAPGAAEPRVAGPGPSAEPRAGTVTQALERVFSTKEGPEAARAGIEVIGEFFDDALGSTPAQGPPEEPAAYGARDPNPPLESVSSVATAPESQATPPPSHPQTPPGRRSRSTDYNWSAPAVSMGKRLRSTSPTSSTPRTRPST